MSDTNELNGSTVIGSMIQLKFPELTPLPLFKDLDAPYGTVQSDATTAPSSINALSTYKGFFKDPGLSPSTPYSTSSSVTIGRKSMLSQTTTETADIDLSDIEISEVDISDSEEDKPSKSAGMG